MVAFNKTGTLIAFIIAATLAAVAQRSAGCASPPLAGYYFASSYASAGKVAWLFALDPKPGKGVAFTPHGETAALRDISATDEGGWTFTARIHSAVWKFLGRQCGHVITGAFGPTGSREGAILNLKWVAPLRGPEDPIAGLYSNTFEAHGDLGGYDLLLLPGDLGSLEGFFVAYEGMRGTSLALVGARLSGHELQIRVEQPGSDMLLAGTVAPGQVVLSCRLADFPQTSCFFGTQTITLPKKAPLSAFLPIP